MYAPGAGFASQISQSTVIKFLDMFPTLKKLPLHKMWKLRCDVGSEQFVQLINLSHLDISTCTLDNEALMFFQKLILVKRYDLTTLVLGESSSKLILPEMMNNIRKLKVCLDMNSLHTDINLSQVQFPQLTDLVMLFKPQTLEQRYVHAVLNTCDRCPKLKSLYVSYMTADFQSLLEMRFFELNVQHMDIFTQRILGELKWQNNWQEVHEALDACPSEYTWHL